MTFLAISNGTLAVIIAVILADIFLIALTGYGQMTDRAAGKRAGFDEHLVKPVNVDELLRLLDALRSARDAAGIDVEPQAATPQ